MSELDPEANSDLSRAIDPTLAVTVEQSNPVFQVGTFSYEEWALAHTAQVLTVYDQLKARLDVSVNSINLHQYFNSPKMRPLIVILTHPFTLGTNIAVYERAVCCFKRSVMKLYHKVHPDCSGTYENLVDLLKILWEVLGADVIRSWIEEGPNGSMNNARRTAKHRARSENGLIPPAKKARQGSQQYTGISQVDDCARNIRLAATTAELKNQFAVTRIIRLGWINSIKDAPTGIVSTFAEKFPSLKEDVSLIHDDYIYIMEKKYNFVPSIFDVLNVYAPSIIAVGKTRGISEISNNDIVTTALVMLPDIITSYGGKRFKQSPNVNKVYISSDFPDVKSMIEQKKKLTTAPVVIQTTWEEESWFLCVDDIGLKIPNNDGLSSGVQSLYELYYVFNLAFDPDMHAFFALLEHLAGFTRSKLAGSMTNLLNTIVFQYQQSAIADQNTPPFSTDTIADQTTPPTPEAEIAE